MKTPSEVSTITEAKSYIEYTCNHHIMSENPVKRSLARYVHGLSSLYRAKRTVLEYQTQKIALAHAIEATTRDSAVDSLDFAPSLFFLIKYDFAISDDLESSDIVRYRLLNSLAFILDLPGDGLTIEKIKSFDTYLLFLNSALLYRQQIEEHRLTGNLPYTDLVADYEASQRNLKRNFARELLPALKSEMRKFDHATYEGKKQLVKWVNAELRRLDFSIRSPKTGNPSTFKVNPGKDSTVGLLQLVSKDSEGVDRTFSATELESLLEKLELMDDPPRRESIMEWRDKVGIDRGSARRGE